MEKCELHIIFALISRATLLSVIQLIQISEYTFSKVCIHVYKQAHFISHLITKLTHGP